MAAVPPQAWLIMGGGLVAGALVGSLVARDDETDSGPEFTPLPVGGEWVDPNAPSRIAYYADLVAEVTGWGNTLRRFLIPVAYWESRGNSQACHGACELGSARGWFQLRKGAKCLENSGYTPDSMLFSEPAQVAIAACHAYQLGTAWKSPGQKVETRDVRRGWKFPSWVKTSYRNDPATFHNRDSYMETLQVMGDTPNFAYAPMFPPGFYWPGLDAVLEAVGA